MFGSCNGGSGVFCGDNILELLLLLCVLGNGCDRGCHNDCGCMEKNNGCNFGIGCGNILELIILLSIFGGGCGLGGLGGRCGCGCDMGCGRGCDCDNNQTRNSCGCGCGCGPTTCC